MAHPEDTVETETERICAYKETLKDLVKNVRHVIQLLTELALAESSSESASAGIARVIEDRIREVRSIHPAPNRPASKLAEMQMSLLYLIDSIVKNDHNPDHRYLNLFTQNIVSNFCEFYRRADSEMREKKLKKLRGTWTGIFSDDKLSALDRRIKSLDPEWPFWPRAAVGNDRTGNNNPDRAPVPAVVAAAAQPSLPGSSNGHHPNVHFNRNFLSQEAPVSRTQPQVQLQPQSSSQPNPVSDAHEVRQETLKRLQEAKRNMRLQELQQLQQQSQSKRKLLETQPHSFNNNNNNINMSNNNNRKKQKGGRAGGQRRDMRGGGRNQQQVLQPQVQHMGPALGAGSAVITPSNPIYSRRPIVVQQPMVQSTIPFGEEFIDNSIIHPHHQLLPQQQTGGGLFAGPSDQILVPASAVLQQSLQYQMVGQQQLPPAQQQQPVLSQTQVPPHSTMADVIRSTNSISLMPNQAANTGSSSSGSGSQTNPLQSVYNLLGLSSNKTNPEANSSASSSTAPPAAGASGGSGANPAAAGGASAASVSMKRISPIPRMFRNEPPIEWTSESLRIPRKSIIAKLYNGQQCSSCSERFKRHDDHFYQQNPDILSLDTKTYENHVQWHYRQNNAKRSRSNKAPQSRPWYYKLSDWLLFKEINDELGVEQQAFADMVAGQGEEEDEADLKTVIARTDEKENVCNVCHEDIEPQFREEDEQWILMNAVLHEEKVYHPACLQDYLKNDQHNDTNEEAMETNQTLADAHDDEKSLAAEAGAEQEKEEETEKKPNDSQTDAQPEQKEVQEQDEDEHEALNFDADEEEEEEEEHDVPESEVKTQSSPSSRSPVADDQAAGDSVPPPAVNVVMRGCETSAACTIM